MRKNDDIKSWLTGPEFLYQTREKWPHPHQLTGEQTDSTREETCVVNIVDVHLSKKVNDFVSSGDILDMKKIFKIQNYSSMQKLLRVTCYVIKFIQRLKIKANRAPDMYVCADEITASELKYGRMLWVKNEQNLILSNPKRVKDLEYSLGLFIDNDILRLRGRMQNSDSEFDSKFPIFLDKDSYFTELVILDCHKKVKHSRVKDTLNQFRSNYWITQKGQA